MSLEIERKFLIRADCKDAVITKTINITQIRQTYIKENDPEVRLRCYNRDEYYICVKTGSGLVREEAESKVNNQFEVLFNNSKVIEKTRYQVPNYSCSLEFDEYHGKFDGLWVMEIEFRSEEDAAKYSHPEWVSPFVISEITGRKEYSNSSLARQL